MLVPVYILGKTPNNPLDIGKDTDKLTGREKVFYNDQLSTTQCRLSKVIDEEYELEVQTKPTVAATEETRKDDGVFHVLESETNEELSNKKDATSFLLQELKETTLNFNASLNPSGLGRYVTPTNEIAVQTDDCNADKPRIRRNRNCTDRIKATYAHVSTKCRISIEMARIAVKTTCSYFKHNIGSAYLVLPLFKGSITNYVITTVFFLKISIPNLLVHD